MRPRPPVCSVPAGVHCTRVTPSHRTTATTHPPTHRHELIIVHHLHLPSCLVTLHHPAAHHQLRVTAASTPLPLLSVRLASLLASPSPPKPQPQPWPRLALLARRQPASQHCIPGTPACTTTTIYAHSYSRRSTLTLTPPLGAHPPSAILIHQQPTTINHQPRHHHRHRHRPLPFSNAAYLHPNQSWSAPSSRTSTPLVRRRPAAAAAARLPLGRRAAQSRLLGLTVCVSLFATYLSPPHNNA